MLDPLAWREQYHPEVGLVHTLIDGCSYHLQLYPQYHPEYAKAGSVAESHCHTYRKFMLFLSLPR